MEPQDAAEASPQTYKKSVAYLAVVAAVFITTGAFSFVIFNSNVPQTPEHPEVKGLSKEEFNLTYPPRSETISAQKLSGGFEATFKSELLPEDLKFFYANTLKAQGWKLEDDSYTSEFYAAEYRGGDNKLYISATASGKEKDHTIVVLTLEN